MSYVQRPILAAVCLLLAATLAPSARAQSCPSNYAACDNGGCCLASDQCCPTLEEGCCPGSTPFCCGDGSCAASPGDCATAGRNTCNGYDIPCGPGCAPAGSQCCDLVGHYCAPQGVCTSETACIAGDLVSPALQVLASSSPEPSNSSERMPSPISNPPNGTERSCAFAPSAPSRFAASSLTSLLALTLLRRRGTRRSASVQGRGFSARFAHRRE